MRSHDQYRRESGSLMYRILVALLTVAIGLAAAFALLDFDHRAINWGRFVAVGGVVLPVVLGAIGMVSRRGRNEAVAFIAAASLIEGLALAAPAALMFLLRGLSQSRTHTHEMVLLGGYVIVLLAMAVVALIAFFSLPAPDRRYGVLGLSAFSVVLYLGFGWDELKKLKLDNSETRTASIREYNDEQARKTVSAIAECAREFARAHPGEGLPGSLSALGSRGCLPTSLGPSSPEKRYGTGSNGYQFFYFADPPGAEGGPQRFAICARPFSLGDGSVVLGLNPAGTMQEMPGISGDSKSSCFSAWAGDDDASFLQAFAGCLMNSAALSPGRGYPKYLFVGDDPAGACDMGQVRGARGGRLVTPRGVLEYLPALRDGHGRITSYTVLLFGNRSGSGALSIDQSGRIQAGLYPQVASTLEAVEAARPAETVKAEQLAVRRSLWAQACQSGDLETCESLGDFEWEMSQPEQARLWWDQACERGRLQSCLLGSRYNPVDPGAGRANKERCLEGEEASCRALAELVVTMRPRIEALRASGGMPSATVRGNLAPPSKQ